MIDWSYARLTERERLVLRRLSVFAGSFSLEAAPAVVADCAAGPDEVIETLGSLVDKSLVSVDSGALTARYRLLDTTRAYARVKLEAAGEFHSVARRHAEYFCRVLEGARALAEHWGNVRVALNWSFSDGTNDALGVALAASLMFTRGNCEEVQAALQRAIALAEESENDEQQFAATGRARRLLHAAR